MIEVKQIVEIMEEGDEQYPENKKIVVSSHWNHNDWVVLKVGKREFAVDADDFRAAIENATNVSRY